MRGHAVAGSRAEDADHRLAFDRLYDTHARAVLAYALRRTASADDAEDAASETFIVAWRRLDRVPGVDEALPWLFGVARKVLANPRRAAARRGRPIDRSAAPPPGGAGVRNLLGFAHRMNGDVDASFRFYQRALEINPDHRGAHEYIGRSYLLLGQEDKAREHLAHLERTCMGACPERDSLRAAITEGWPWRKGVRVGQRAY